MVAKAFNGAATVFGNGLNINTMLDKAENSVGKGTVTLGLGASLVMIGTGAASTIGTVINKEPIEYLGKKGVKALGKANIVAASILAGEDVANMHSSYHKNGFISKKDTLSLVGNTLAVAAGIALVANPVGGAVVTGLALASMGATAASLMMDENSQFINKEQIEKIKSSLNEVFLGKPIDNFFDEQVLPMVEKFLEADKSVQELTKKITETLTKADTYNPTKLLEKLLEPVAEFTKEITETVDNSIDKAIDKVKEIIKEIQKAIKEQTDNFIEKIDDLSDHIAGELARWLGLNRDGKHYFVDPLVLDLDGDGIETVGYNKKQGAMFDLECVNDGVYGLVG